MIRRQTRMRREYLYRKALETKDRQIYDRKQALKEAVESGKPIPVELRKEANALRKDLQYDENQNLPTSHIDDEYAQAGVVDAKVLITTSRDPSTRLAMFAKEMRLMLPNAQRINRGNYVLKDIVEACRSNEATDLVILHEHRGQPDGLVISHFPYGPTAYFTLHNVVLRHDIPDRGTVSEQYPHLIFDGFNSKLGERCQNILKYLFPVPKEDSKRVMTFANKSDFISFRHHVYYKVGNEVQLAEVGPRFEMRLYEIKLGTVDVTEADTEWVFRPYQRTAKKRDFL
ncbi:anticodon-binding protein [Fimicolochytrium jonesii]|uniref:anticodon-binding protein n=1 Tax=Fimicolochytrium jonesii TaxID=1396493 RepID=UPI0022FEBB2A|nr:anticodon-binding protein [Fimicolochytrium jonesii]KAI8817082.1 anticodon-binding protein [Fimicolochytrium jonesii]